MPMTRTVESESGASTPFPVQASQVKAAFTDGVLELRLPLPSQEKPQPQAIPIS